MLHCAFSYILSDEVCEDPAHFLKAEISSKLVNYGFGGVWKELNAVWSAFLERKKTKKETKQHA